MTDVEIQVVSSASQWQEFIDLPWSLYQRTSKWIPPLKSDVQRLLDPAKHPYWQTARREMFLAKRQGKTIGRIVAIEDDTYNTFHQERAAAWGFFECIDDLPAASALFAAAENWAKQRGATYIRGPLNPSTNYEVGFLLEGFEQRPMVMMPWTPEYYLRLTEACDYAKEKDLLAYHVNGFSKVNPRVEKISQRLRKSGLITFRTGNRRRWNEDVEAIREIYNSAWEKSWGFVPLSSAEIDELGKTLKPIVDLDLVVFVYYNQALAGVCLILPDYNPLLWHLNGKIGWTGPFKYLMHRKEINGIRTILIGVKPELRKVGVPVVAFDQLNQIVRQQKKYKNLELGWTLEDNDDVNRFSVDLGGRLYKKYRIFRKELPHSASE